MLESRFNLMRISMKDELMLYKAITIRKMVIHPDITLGELDIARNLFPELNAAIRDGKNPERKFQYRVLLKLFVGENTLLFRGYRAILKFLLSL